MNTDERELRDQRAALLKALNAKDWDAVKSVMHPSFKAKAILGLEFSRDFTVGAAKIALMAGTGFRENIQIDEVQIEGDRAELTVTRTDSQKVLGIFPKEDVNRYKEIWEKFDGRWMMLGEEVLG